MKPLASVDEVTPEWLVGVFSRGGRFSQGQLVGIQKEVSRPFGSLVVRIKAEYSQATLPSIPNHFFLKIDNGQTWKEAGQREVVFYNTITAKMSDAPCPRCFDGVWDADTGAYHLLLEDATETHYTIEREAPATETDALRLMDALAKLHANWWGKPEFGEVIDSDLVQGKSDYSFSRFVDFMRDRLPANRRRIYETILADLPALLSRRLTDSHSLTLVHDDAHAWNFLLPHAATGKVFLIDWQQWGVSIGLHDVAYHFTLFWYAERRQMLERTLVKHYHNRLQTYGVQNYDWDACWQDYRLYTARNLLVPLWAFHYGHWAPHRWAQLEKGFTAYADLNCAELLTS